MADLQTALATALQEWEPETKQESKQMETKQPQLFKPTNNVSRETFNFIKAHYGCTSTQVKDAMVERGYKKSSVHSLITQMVRNKLVIRGLDGRLATVVPEYVPIKNRKPTAKKVKAKPKLTKKQQEIVKDLVAPPTDTAPEAGTTPIDYTYFLTAKYVIQNIRVGEAKLLHKELVRIFEDC